MTELLRIADDAAEADVALLGRLAERLNSKKAQLEARGWRGEAVYNWLCLLAGRYLRRFRKPGPLDPAWHVGGWHIGRQFMGPMIGFSVSEDRIVVDSRDGARAWRQHNRLC